MKNKLSILLAILVVSIVPMKAFAFPNMKMYTHAVTVMNAFGSPKTYGSKEWTEMTLHELNSGMFYICYDPITDLRLWIAVVDDLTKKKCIIENSTGQVESSDETIVYYMDEGFDSVFLVFEEKGRVIFLRAKDDLRKCYYMLQTFENDSTSKNL